MEGFEEVLMSGEATPVHFVISSIVLVGVILLLRLLVNYSILRRSTLTIETRRRWAVNVRNALLCLLVFGLLII